MDSAALARQLAELDKVATPGPWWPVLDGLGIQMGDIGGFALHKDQGPNPIENLCLFVTLRNNLPAILRALCVMVAVDELERGNCDHCAKWMKERANELLAECTGAK